MPLEIEAKVKVEDLRPVREALLAAGAQRVSKVREVNTYFMAADPEVALRTRQEIDEAGTMRSRVTYKGPRQPGRFKRREEIEFDVTDADAAGELLDRLGHQRAMVFEKDRETFILDDCEIVLDELPLLGTFVEVEGPTEEAIHAALTRVGLGDAPTISTGYASMIRNLLVKTGATELRF